MQVRRHRRWCLSGTGSVVDDHVPQRQHLRLVAHNDLTERPHGCPTRRQARQRIRVSTIGGRVLCNARYVRVGLADDRLAEEAFGRVRALYDLRHTTMRVPGTRVGLERRGHHRKRVPDDDDADEQRDAR